MKETGVVYLVGAGPGDPGLITEKGLSRLKHCDAVVYDSLASDRLLWEVPADCEKIYVGKRAGSHSMKQEEINRLLVELAGKGYSVVRLKGGDPFVFGRGGEEILALQEAGIPYEVVSGVTSAVAALASAGIPVTHRALSRSFHVMTGHTLSGDGTLPPDFNAFARLSGTLVFLMGLGNLSLIVKGLRKEGKSGETPAAVIESGTLPGQRIVRGTLADIKEKVLESGIKSPAVIVVGEAAALDFSSTRKAPLEGCRIGMTGTPSFTGKLHKELTLLGAATEYLLSLSVKSYKTGDRMREAYKNLSGYTWIVFTSANAVREFFSGLMECGYDSRAVGHVKFASVGNGTARELLRYGFRADYTPETYQVRDLAVGLKKLISGKDRILIPRSSRGSRELNQILEETDVFFDDVVLYDVVSGNLDSEKENVAAKDLNYVTFASASGVEGFFEAGGRQAKEWLDGVKVVCIGDITAEALIKHGRKADLVAEVYSIPGVAEAICRDWQSSTMDKSMKGKIQNEV